MVRRWSEVRQYRYQQQAGVRFEAPEQLRAGGSMDTVRRGGYDPHAHVEDMDADSVAGGVLYPSQG